MNADSDATERGQGSMTIEFPEISEFELQVQWSEFVPNPLHFLILNGNTSRCAK